MNVLETRISTEFTYNYQGLENGRLISRLLRIAMFINKNVDLLVVVLDKHDINVVTNGVPTSYLAFQRDLICGFRYSIINFTMKLM